MKTLAIVVGTGRSRDPSGESQNQSQRLAAQAQHLLERLATATGRLAGNKSACDRTRESVRGDLAQLDASLTTLSRQAACNLPPSSLARAAITGVAQAAARATGELQKAEPDPGQQQALHKASTGMRSLASAVGQIDGSLSAADVARLAEELRGLSQVIDSAG